MRNPAKACFVKLTVRLLISACCFPLIYWSGTHAQVAQAAPSGMQSDPASVKILESVLQHAGGRTAWAQIHSMELYADVSMSGVSGSHKALLLDDWSTTDTKYRRRFEGRSGAAKDHNGISYFAAQMRGATKRVPEFDQSRVLLTHVPFAAAEIMLRRTEYKILPPRFPRCAADTLCFDVYRTIAPTGYGLREQEWTISKATNMPTKIRLIQPNSGTGIMKWKEIDYGQFESQAGLSMPTDEDVILPGGIKQHWHYSGAKPNATFDTKAFDREFIR